MTLSLNPTDQANIADVIDALQTRGGPRVTATHVVRLGIYGLRSRLGLLRVAGVQTVERLARVHGDDARVEFHARVGQLPDLEVSIDGAERDDLRAQTITLGVQAEDTTEKRPTELPVYMIDTATGAIFDVGSIAVRADAELSVRIGDLIDHLRPPRDPDYPPEQAAWEMALASKMRAARDSDADPDAD